MNLYLSACVEGLDISHLIFIYLTCMLNNYIFRFYTCVLMFCLLQYFIYVNICIYVRLYRFYKLIGSLHSTEAME